jgi:hypothetical protein
VPPLGEQCAAVNELECSTEQPASLYRDVEQQITAMEEHRTRLIADAVTGQIDVRGAR